MSLLRRSCCVIGLVFLVQFAGPSPGAVADDKKPAFPKGSEKAVAAVQEAFPKAEVDEVTEPKGFGGSGGKGTPMFWSIRFHVDDKKHELSVLLDGTIMRFPTTVDVKDLPKVVADAVAKAAPESTVRSAEKNEMRATLKYVASEKAHVRQYVIEVVQDKKRSRVTMNGEAGDLKVTELEEERKADGTNKPDLKEIDLPAKAAKSVKAIKALYPDAVVVEVTTQVFDDGTGDIEILTYEIEFFSKGVKHEMVASPEGVIPHLWATIEPKNFPKAVTDAIEKALPGAKVENAKAFEFRASLKFGAIEKPKVYYTVSTDKEGKTVAIRVKPDGTLIKDVGFPKAKSK